MAEQLNLRRDRVNAASIVNRNIAGDDGHELMAALQDMAGVPLDDFDPACYFGSEAPLADLAQALRHGRSPDLTVRQLALYLWAKKTGAPSAGLLPRGERG